MGKLVIIYTFLMASGVTVESEPFQPLVEGRAVRCMEMCAKYAAASAKRMNEAMTVSHASPFMRVEARCERNKP